ncbi:MAG: cupin domain-containing protein [Oscillatoria sp. PMC 1068.18]|nr:cupin domain-containing protein [Oscillatoria sp. PMC 1076.18]MEC4991322.1 cupin domain-containing protein [Oscillatoria sp. PMC 1068.18]
MSQSKSINIEQLKQKWENKGLICEIWELSPGDSWSDPGHKTDEFFLLLEGEMEVSCQGQISDLKVGHETMIPAKESHTVTNRGKTVSRVCWIHYPNFS